MTATPTMRNRTVTLVVIAVGVFGAMTAISWVNQTVANVIGGGLLIAVLARLFFLRR